jgi:hypothetical protein
MNIAFINLRFTLNMIVIESCDSIKTRNKRGHVIINVILGFLEYIRYKSKSTEIRTTCTLKRYCKSHDSWDLSCWDRKWLALATCIEQGVKSDQALYCLLTSWKCHLVFSKIEMDRNNKIGKKHENKAG